MKQYKILILFNNTTIHQSIMQSLFKSGHQIKLVYSCFQLLKEARRIRPDLVLVHYAHSDSVLKQTLRIIETDLISSIVYLVDSLSEEMLSQLDQSRLCSFIPLDTSPNLFPSFIEILSRQSNERLSQEQRIIELEGDLADRKAIDNAKRLLIKKWNLTEDQAYKILRKRSMDQCKSISIIANEILNAE